MNTTMFNAADYVVDTESVPIYAPAIDNIVRPGEAVFFPGIDDDDRSFGRILQIDDYQKDIYIDT